MSIAQRKALSDFLNTVAAAWLTAGIIAPIFAPNYPLFEFLFSIASGAAGSLALLTLSLILVREINS